MMAFVAARSLGSAMTTDSEQYTGFFEGSQSKESVLKSF